MASGGTVEIQVQLQGADNVQKRLNQIGQGANVAGQKFSAAGSAIAASSNTMTSAMGGVVSSVGTLAQGVGGLASAASTAGTGIAGMLGPIAAVGAAVVGLIYAFRRYIDTTNDLDERLEAIKKGAAEFTTVLEQLADANVELTATEHAGLMQMATNAQMQTEYIHLLREGNGVLGKRIELAQREQARAASALQVARDEAEAQRTAIRIRLQNNRQLTVERRAQLEDLEVRRLSHRAQVAYNRAAAHTARIEAELIPLIEEAARAKRELANETERLTETRGRSSVEAAERERAKLLQENANTLRSIGALQIQTEAEAAQARMSTLAFQTRQLQSQQHQRISQVRALEQAQLARINTVFESEKAALTQQLELQTITARSYNERVASLEAQRAQQQQQFASDRELAETLIVESALQRRRALRRAAAERRRAAAAQEQAQLEAMERARFQDRQRLREEEIRRDAQGFEQQRQLINLRFETAQRLAQNEIQTQTAVLVQRRELLAVQQQEQEATRKATAERLKALQQSFALMQQDLALLEVYDRAKQLDIELTREQAQALADLNATDMSTITNAVSSFSQGLMYSAFAALQSGKSLKAATGEALKSIAIQAGVESVMETARGIAALATGLPTDAVLAAKHFQAAAFFATAAGAAGVVGAKLSPNGGGGGGGGGASPTGTAQSVRDFDRDEREERGSVTINVIMGQATIYDTKAAAERAFADRVVSAINSPRRGAVRLRRS
jgi:hypothetical protein